MAAKKVNGALRSREHGEPLFSACSHPRTDSVYTAHGTWWCKSCGAPSQHPEPRSRRHAAATAAAEAVGGIEAMARAVRAVHGAQALITPEEARVMARAVKRSKRQAADYEAAQGLVVGSPEYVKRLQRQRLNLQIELDFAQRKLEAADELCTRMANQTTLTAQTFFDFTRELRAILDRMEPR